MARTIGPRLLGRIPSPPDGRDWKLAPFLADDVSLRDQGVALIKRTKYGYLHWAPGLPPATSNMAKGLALLAQIGAPAPPAPTPTGDVIWVNPEAVLDQGDFGTCVGNGFAQWGNTLPVDDKFTEIVARAIYLEATILDGSPDDPDAPGGGQQGATVRSGAKAMVARKRIGAYAFAASIDEVIDFLTTKGPVVFGTDWTSGMFSPSSTGFVAPTGAVEGGHCYVAVGYLASQGAILFLNSWGSSWGLAGYFKMKVADARTLFAQQGEALAAVELAL